MKEWLATLDRTIPRSTRLAIIIGGFALVLSSISPIIAANNRLILLLFAAVFGFVGAIIFLQKPFLGIAATIIAALMVPFAIGTGSGTGINAAILLLVFMIALWFFDEFARKKRFHILVSRPVLAAFVFCIVSLLAFGFGQIPWFSVRGAPITAQIGGLMVFLLSAMTILLIAHQFHSIQELKWITWVFLACGALYILGRLIPGSNRYIYKIFVRQATLGSVFYVWLIAIAASQSLFNRELNKGLRIALAGLVLGAFAINLFISNRFWTSGWLPAFVGVICMVLIAKPRLGVMGFLVGSVVILLNWQFSSSIFSGGDNEYSLITRLEAWSILLDMVKANPVFGLGMANYYWYTPLYSIFGYHVSFNSHNNYIDLIAQTGIVGLVSFFWLVWEIGMSGLRLLRKPLDAFSQAYVYGALGGLAGTVFAGLLGDWVVPFVYNIGLEGFRASMLAWIFLGGLLVLEKLK